MDSALHMFSWDMKEQMLNKRHKSSQENSVVTPVPEGRTGTVFRASVMNLQGTSLYRRVFPYLLIKYL